MTILRAACFSDIGKVRKENEDRILFDEEAQLFGVADGVGGLPGGAEAAQAAVDVVTAGVQLAPADDELDLGAIVGSANDAVVALGLRISPGLGIGSTARRWAASAARGSSWRTSAIRGRSRWRDGRFICLTEDHSVENEAKRRRARGEVVYYSEIAARGADPLHRPAGPARGGPCRPSARRGRPLSSSAPTG